jgi:hypothetical protein
MLPRGRKVVTVPHSSAEELTIETTWILPYPATMGALDY